ncbi:MAG: hypothetical protein KC503_18575, partial [Myxococcales bacterium]|nr:hypothetical protein [Myxococcales bacterium]
MNKISVFATIVGLAVAACAAQTTGPAVTPPPPDPIQKAQRKNANNNNKPTPIGPTAAQATAFIEKAEQELLGLWIAAERSSWVKSTYISYDTALLAAKAHEALMAR